MALYQKFLKLDDSYKDIGTHIRIGMDFDTSSKTGYWIYVYPVIIEHKEGFRTVSFTAFSGYKKKLKDTKRRSKFAQNILEQYINNNLKEIVKPIIDRYNITIDDKELNPT